MPHIILEYAKPLKKIILTTEFKTNLIKNLLNYSNFHPNNIKYRSIQYSDYFSACSQAFIYLTIKILPGRTQKQKINISEANIKYFKEKILINTKFKKKYIEFTIQIEELDSRTYKKLIC